MISFIWLATESVKFCNIESIKILFKLTKRDFLVTRLNNTNIYNTIINNTFPITREKEVTKKVQLNAASFVHLHRFFT